MRPLTLTALVFSALTLAACAPQATQPSRATVTPNTRSSSISAADEAKFKAAFPLKFGETWTLAANQADDSESKELPLKLSDEPTVEQDDDGEAYVFAEGNTGEFDAGIFYYPEDKFFFVTVLLENARRVEDAKAVYCFFSDVESGKVRIRGAGFIGTGKALRAVKDRSGFGDCTLSRR